MVVFPSSRQDARANNIREIVKEKGHTIIEQPPSARGTGFAQALNDIAPDAILVWSYPMILPKEVLEIPKRGAVNVHLGLLPEYRGVNGVRWALLNGEDQTGVTLHFMDAGIDSGNMIARASFPIAPEDDIRSLMQKSKIAGRRLLENSWAGIVSGNLRTMPQDESKAKYYSAKMTPSCEIDWSKSNVDIHNLIRASAAPFARAYTSWNGGALLMKKSSPVDAIRDEKRPGTVEHLDSSGLTIATGKGDLLITEIELDGETIKPGAFSDLGIKPGIVLPSLQPDAEELQQ